MKKSLYLGIDIGGTTTKIGFINEKGEIKKNWEIETRKKLSRNDFITYLWASVKHMAEKHNIKLENLRAIGLGSAGFINPEDGIICDTVNIGWKDFPIVKMFTNISGLPVFLENDANIASLGELWQGSGSGENNIIMITLGTGVGSGIIIDGRVLSGENATAGEIGHIIVEPRGDLCNCGRRGCLETITSATGIVRQAMKLIQKYPASHLSLFYKKKGDISAKDIFNLAKKGDPHSLEIVDNVGDVLGLVLANLAVTVNPKKVIIGGGVSKAGDLLLESIIAGFNKYALARVKDMCEIELASLQNNAGIIGAAYLAKLNTND